MGRRERMERRLEKRREWAASAARHAEERLGAADGAVAGIEPGQPILIGHHSEKRHRRAIARHDANMGKAIEYHDKAENHESKANGLERQLKKTVFSDDDDAIEALTEKADRLTVKADREVAINKAWRKGKGSPGWADGLLTPGAADSLALSMSRCPWLKGPCFAGHTRAEVRRCKKRIETIRTQQTRQAKAEQAGGVLVEDDGGWARVTFPEKPDRAILDDLRAADYRWGGGYWSGKLDRLPASVRELQEDTP